MLLAFKKDGRSFWLLGVWGIVQRLEARMLPNILQCTRQPRLNPGSLQQHSTTGLHFSDSLKYLHRHTHAPEKQRTIINSQCSNPTSEQLHHLHKGLYLLNTFVEVTINYFTLRFKFWIGIWPIWTMSYQSPQTCQHPWHPHPRNYASEQEGIPLCLLSDRLKISWNVSAAISEKPP